MPETTVEKADAVSTVPGDTNEVGGIDACALLTGDEIKSVHGEEPANAKRSGKTEGGLSVSQCIFVLPTRSNAITLRVVQRASGPKARDPKQVWEETFHKIAPEAAQSKSARKPQRVDGIGEEAFWLGNLKVGGLHVLKGNSYIRIWVGGEDDLETKIKKASALAQMLFQRL